MRSNGLSERLDRYEVRDQLCFYCCEAVKYPDGVYGKRGKLFHKECVKKYRRDVYEACQAE